MFLSYFKIIFTKYFSHSIFWSCFLFPNPSRSVLPSLMIFLYLSEKQKQKINKPKTVRQKKSQNKNPQDNMELILHWPTISRHGPALKCGWHLVTAHWKKLLFISKQTSTANSFLIRGGTLPPLLFSVLGFLPGLNLYRSWACCHGLCAFIYASVVLCVGDKVPLEWYLT